MYSTKDQVLSGVLTFIVLPDLIFHLTLSLTLAAVETFQTCGFCDMFTSSKL